MVASALGVLAMTAVSTYAPGTTSGVIHDVQALTSAVASVFQSTIYILMNIATLFAPAAVLAVLLFRRQFWLALQGLVAGVAGFGLATAAAWGIMASHYDPMIRGMSVFRDGHWVVAIAPLAAAMAGILTAVGPRSRRPIYRLSWNLLWLALAALVLTGGATLPAAVVTVLLGRVVGQAVRYLGGVSTDRAAGRGLIDGIRRAGLDPARIVRVRDISDPENPTERLRVDSIRDGSFDPSDSGPHELPESHHAVSDSTALALERLGGNRVYAVYTTAGERWDTVVLDGDRQMVSLLQRTWRALRLRGMDQRAMVSLRQAAERAALLGFAAASAGVRTPALRGITDASDSMMLIQEHPAGLRSIRDMRAQEVEDQAVEEAWRQLKCAHDAGLAHRSITQDCLLFGVGQDGHQCPWLTGWDNGDVASSELARALDRAQMAAMLSLRLGPERTVAAASKVLDAAALAQVASLIQPVALPNETREEARGHKDVLETLRQSMLDLAPGEPPVHPPSLVRLSWSKVIILTLALVAVMVVLTSFNFGETMAAVRNANPWWMALSFGLAMATYVGAAMTLKAFYRDRLSLWKTTLCQVAASFWALVAPGGVGPMATALRFLYKQGSKTSIAVATVALANIVAFSMTVVVILVTALVSGDSGVLSNLPSTAILLVIVALAVLASTLLIPRLRAWIWVKIGPTFTQVWPVLTWVVTRPKRVIFALAGAALQTGGYVASFWAALQAFGLGHLSIVNIVLVFLVGNSVGSAVPTPGGLGGVELSLTAGLRAAGVATAVAASAAVLYRAVTYWARVPLGWVAFRYLQRHDDI